MKKILLVCAAGMSTSLLVERMKARAAELNIESEIEALSISEASNKIDSVDIVMLGPQVRYQEKQIKDMAAGRIPVTVIDMLAYGKMDGTAVLDKALELIG
ncbi:PTS system cellobiose-specific transporter subunit IIB [Listeria floridensis FSL S10-1187]|uniref:PTS system cellobiose-specific transporter subunit IIB n=1 Tax=Listeria floridensis FSL S10-1187 TaxID=1265817 RepID=A0ABN0REY0_9LIST|nr:PTS sugar transporter subunit IIB [Listeria floridensis]EUJ31686.1 PTS system cellobiose-specific transporter subunit IIB [Listeria floridensis FSL S10-1187]